MTRVIWVTRVTRMARVTRVTSMTRVLAQPISWCGSIEKKDSLLIT